MQSTKLNSTDKLLISIVLGWQYTNKVCYETNKALAFQLGLEVDGLRTAIKRLNKLPFFNSIRGEVTNEYGRIISDHTITIDEKALESFLSAPVEPKIKKEKLKPVVIETPSTPIVEIKKPMKKFNLQDEIQVSSFFSELGYQDDVLADAIIKLTDRSTFNIKELVMEIKDISIQTKSSTYVGPSKNELLELTRKIKESVS